MLVFTVYYLLFIGIYCLVNITSYSSKCTVMLSGINHFIVAIWKVFIFPWLLMHQSNPSVPNPSFPTPGHFPVKRVRGLGIWTQTFAGGGAFEIKDLQVLQSSSTCAYAKKNNGHGFLCSILWVRHWLHDISFPMVGNLTK